MDRLAQSAGVSRTTVYHLERGDISKPRASTLYKLAVALEVAPEELTAESLAEESLSTEELPQESQPGPTRHLEFDKSTNVCVKKAYRISPDKFSAWSDQDWEELYSTFGVGGPLSEQGVLAIAEKINRKRETFQQLGIILETHHAEVAAGLIENLYQLVQAESDTALSGSANHQISPEDSSSSP